MEFLDEDARPRFVLQSKSTPPQTTTSYISSLHKPTLFVSLPLSLLFLFLSLFTFNFEPFQSLLIWISVSLFIGPFAPPSLTAGDISVGKGPLIKSLIVVDDESDANSVGNKRFIRKSSRSVAKIESLGGESGFEGKKGGGYVLDLKKNEGGVCKDDGYVLNSKKNEEVEEGKWSEGDVEMLKKLMGKHPVGKPGRWEAITEGFKGRYKVESVIKKSKELGEKKVSDEDSFKKFLKDRKPVDRRVELENEEVKGEGAGVVWSAGEDLALLNALKAFPKDVAMRWEKIAAAVPGKSKAECVKRVAELKKDFRSSKTVAGEN
ncbi:chaperone [Lithospermum erythrorhizon]|uniref:Chaperone n=1 Tax=Lithospermum erythrorhizon TaxID=34254 RepID=A0AAV3PBV5_LITER